MEESVACMRRIGDRRLINRTRVALGQVLVPLNDFAIGEPLARETLADGLELGAPRDIHYSLHYLGDYALIRGDGPEALGWYAQSMEAALAYGNAAEAALELEALAMALAAEERREAAVRLGAAAARRMAELDFDTSGVLWWGELKERFLGVARGTRRAGGGGVGDRGPADGLGGRPGGGPRRRGRLIGTLAETRL